MEIIVFKEKKVFIKVIVVKVRNMVKEEDEEGKDEFVKVRFKNYKKKIIK